MRIVRHETDIEAGKLAADEGAAAIRCAVEERGEAAIIVATGASQFHMITALVQEPDVAWNKVTVFHLDEYVGIPITHPASFRLYLWERFHSKLPLPAKAFHYINAEKDSEIECQRVGKLITKVSIDVCFAGIGENGHLAFNDPPADFETEKPYVVVDLDEGCRRQQFGEGWFQTMESVPKKAISMSNQQIMKSRKIICTIPDERKAEAVCNAIEGEVTPAVPASILQRHNDVVLHLDACSASRLTK